MHRLRLFRQKSQISARFNKWPSIKHYSTLDFDCQRWHVTKTFELIADYLQLDTRGLDAYDGGARADYAGGGAVSGVAKRKSGGD